MTASRTPEALLKAIEREWRHRKWALQKARSVARREATWASLRASGVPIDVPYGRVAHIMHTRDGHLIYRWNIWADGCVWRKGRFKTNKSYWPVVERGRGVYTLLTALGIHHDRQVSLSVSTKLPSELPYISDWEVGQHEHRAKKTDIFERDERFRNLKLEEIHPVEPIETEQPDIFDSSELVAIGDTIIVTRTPPAQMTESGIHLVLGHDHDRGELQTETILAVGMGQLLKDGSYLPSSLKKGMRVVFGYYNGRLETTMGRDIRILQEKDILGYVEGDEFIPLGDRLVVEPFDDTPGTIELINKPRPMAGTVLAAGPGRYSNTGKLLPQVINVGDNVSFSKMAGTWMTIGGEKRLIMRERDIFGVLQ